MSEYNSYFCDQKKSNIIQRGFGIPMPSRNNLFSNLNNLLDESSVKPKSSYKSKIKRSVKSISQPKHIPKKRSPIKRIGRKAHKSNKRSVSKNISEAYKKRSRSFKRNIPLKSVKGNRRVKINKITKKNSDIFKNVSKRSNKFN